MNVVRTITDLRVEVSAHRERGESIGFVPTMGALHDGHLSLVRAARVQNDVVVLSVFVNPLQFGPAEDLAAYPRDERRDLELAATEAVDVSFLPSVDEMYGTRPATRVVPGEVAAPLEGVARPGHFDGVATVVAKLLNAVQPDRAYFGQKDAQQVAVVKSMVRDLSFPVDVVVCPTVREPDGLAMSSRNGYLNEEERKHATVLWRALQEGRRILVSGATIDVAEKAMEALVADEPGVSLEYARVVDPESFHDPVPGGSNLLVVAATVGGTRLIDNLTVES